MPRQLEDPRRLEDRIPKLDKAQLATLRYLVALASALIAHSNSDRAVTTLLWAIYKEGVA